VDVHPHPSQAKEKQMAEPQPGVAWPERETNKTRKEANRNKLLGKYYRK
jgi:hypothetical protein